MNMIMNPLTNEIMTEDMFQGVPNWQNIEFVKITDCKEIETDTHFVLEGKVNGWNQFKAYLTHEEYFDGKFYKLN